MVEAVRQGLAEPRILETPATARPRVPVGRLPTVPAHVGTMLGLSVAGYGVALALVTGLQASSEAAVIADREPVSVALDQLGAGHDRLGRSIEDAAGLYAGAAAAYQSIVDRLGAIEGQLGTLAGAVKAVDGASRALPASVAMPPVVRSVRTTTTTSTTHATSGGSAP